MLAEQHDYFFVLYIINFVAEGWLAILALFHYPSEDNMEPLPDDPNHPVIYQARCLHFDLVGERPCCFPLTTCEKDIMIRKYMQW